MKAWGSVFGILLLVAGVSQARAEDEATAVAGANGNDVHLLDQVPDYATILAHQWSDGVPQDVTDSETSTEKYGRLINAPLQPTTLAECVALALRNNTDLQISRLGPTAATAGVRKSRAIFDPTLFGNINRDRNNSPATTFLTGGNATTLFNESFTANAGLRKTLISGGQLSLQFNNTRRLANASIANLLLPQYITSLGLSLNQPLLRNFGWKYSLLMVEMAQSMEQSAYEQYAAALTQLVAMVEKGYWALVLATENVHVQEQGLALATELLRQNQGKFNVGALPQTAVLEAKVDVASREALLIQARNSLDVARDNLRALLNARQPGAASLIMIDPQDKPTVEPYQIDLNRSLQMALEQRPEIHAARLDVHSHGLQRKVAENQLLPSLNLVGGIGVNGTAGTRQKVPFGFVTDPKTGLPIDQNTGLPVDPKDPNARAIVNQITAPPSVEGGYSRSLDLLTDGRYYNYAVGATIEIPLANASAKADYATANINLAQSQLSLQKMQEQVTLEIKTSVSNLQSDLRSIEATRIARQLAEENVRNQKARYDVGLATTKDLLDYADRLTRAQFAEVESLTQYNSDLAEMRRVEGSLLAARNIVLERVRPETTPWWATF
ncbi:MAG: TolC family protein [Deltaproteobacteria bacterium]|nr:TolC family protein [Deltaproteobacteria bacterium]